MRQYERFSALAAAGGKYSHRKVPRWRMTQTDVLDYLDDNVHYLPDGDDVPLRRTGSA